MKEQNRLGEMLMEAKMITPEQLTKALEYQKSAEGRLGEIIEKLGFVKEDVMVDFLARQQELPVINPAEVIWPEGLIKKIPQSLIEKYTFLPIAKRDDVLTIAISDPTDYEAIEEIQLVTNMRVEVVLAHRSALKRAIEQIFHKSRSATKEPKSEKVSEPEKGEKDYKTELTAIVQILISKHIISQAELDKKRAELKSK